MTVRGTLRGETKPREVTVFLADAKTSNSLWTKQPDQQLVYAGTRVWARRHAPEVMLGVYAPEEFDRAEPFDGPTIEHTASDARAAINDAVPLKAAAAKAPPAERRVDPTVYETAPPVNPTPSNGNKLRTDEQWRVWLDRLRAACDVLYRREEVVEVANRPSVGDAISTGPAWVKSEISAILAENYGRFPDEAEADELVIPGEDKLAAG